MTRTPIRLLVLLAASFTAIALAVPAQAAAPFCGITWGSLAKQGSATGPGETLTDVRAGRHDCYDRLVLDLRGAPSFTSWSVEYVGQVREDPSDRVVSLAGGADLQIRLHGVDGSSGYHPADPRHLVDVTGFRTLRQVALTGSFERVTSFGVGVRARLPFRVLTVSGIPGTAGGTRVVLDVAHAWQQ
jgi:hypothetical protein